MLVNLGDDKWSSHYWLRQKAFLTQTFGCIAIITPIQCKIEPYHPKACFRASIRNAVAREQIESLAYPTLISQLRSANCKCGGAKSFILLHGSVEHRTKPRFDAITVSTLVWNCKLVLTRSQRRGWKFYREARHR